MSMIRTTYAWAHQKASLVAYRAEGHHTAPSASNRDTNTTSCTFDLRHTLTLVIMLMS
jgi:hypothetical protein